MGRRAVVLIVALLLAGVAAFAIFQYLQGIQEEVEAGQVQVPVFRAAQPIAEGTEGSFVLQSEGVLFNEGFEEEEDLPADAITTREQLQSVLQSRVAAGPISQNQILTSSQWTQLTVEITPLAELLPEGKQALTISPGAVQGVNGFVQPGDRINAIITLDIEFALTALANLEPDFGIPVQDTGGEDGDTPDDTALVRYTRYVLQGLPVIAVGQEIRPDPDAEQPVDVDQGTVQEGGEGEGPAISTVFTLEVTPEQAERLVFAQDAGSLYFTLVPPDFVEVVTRGVTIETLFEGDLVEDIFGN